MYMMLDILSWICLLAGSAVVLVGTAGLIRLPDVYCRMHGTGMTDTMGAFLILLGMALQTELDIVTVKLGLIFVFLMITSPTATHALAQAAMTSGVLPQTTPGPKSADNLVDPEGDVTGGAGSRD